MNKKKATNIRVELETKGKLDKCVVLKTDTYDDIIRRILSEERHLPALERAYKRAHETEEAYKKSEATHTEKAKLLQQSKAAHEYLMQLIKNFIQHVHERSD